jgi:DNA-binding beta-propeller fold protein YncE
VTLRRRRSLLLIILLAAVSTGLLFAGPPRDDRRVAAAKPEFLKGNSPARLTMRSRRVHHYEYVFPDRSMFVYDIDRGHRLVQAVRFPQAAGMRGVGMSTRLHLLFLSFGGDGGGEGNGSMLAYDLVRGRIRWQWSYRTGIDSMAVSRDGRRIFMPTGELSSGDEWRIISASTGRPLLTIHGGKGPHNTVAGLDGKRVYLGGRNSNYLVVVRASDGRVLTRVGPLRSGVRPFTVNGRQTLAFTTATGFLGFQVSSLESGNVLYTVPIKGFTWSPRTFRPSAPSHGISLSPDERQVWVIDAPNSYVHAFDIRGLPAKPPRQIADIALQHKLIGDEDPCAYDCAKDGWVQHSRDGRFLYVGDSGDVISTITRRVVAFVPALQDSRKSIEIDWRQGRPVSTTTRTGLGYVR